MYADLGDHGIAAPDDDLIGARGDELTDDRTASGVVRSDGNHLAGLSAAGVLRVSGCAHDRCGSPGCIERFLRSHLTPPAMADRGDALSPVQQPRKAVEWRGR